MRTKPIVVGVDGSSSAIQAARWAAALAARRDLRRAAMNDPFTALGAGNDPFIALWA